MRSTTLALGAGALLLTATACAGGSEPKAAAGATPSAKANVATSAPSVQPSPSAVAKPAGTDSDKKVCGKINKLIEGDQMKKFGDKLGEMIVYKQAKQTAKANSARAAAQKGLRKLAADFEAATANAVDPELKAAGAETADTIRDSAKDNAFFAKIKTIKDVDKELESEIVPWITPLASFCA
jgi:hypothetical protein